MSSTGQTAVPAVFAFQVSLRRCPQLFAKHRYERTGAVISSLESGGGHFFPGGQQLQSMQQTKLLPPLAEMHSCFLKEYAAESFSCLRRSPRTAFPAFCGPQDRQAEFLPPALPGSPTDAAIGAERTPRTLIAPQLF